MHDGFNHPEGTAKKNTNECKPVMHPVNEVLDFLIHALLLLHIGYFGILPI